ncbi:MAG: copper chaperone PCu(A)C [Gammaproteobacteria bacterium]|nr:copper chaperone PCu(A)C [Gammaproteobacteria bacterium]
MKSKRLISLILFSLSFINPVFADETHIEENLVFENAWIAEAPPVSKVMVAYMTVKNTGSKAIEIIHAESDLYSSIEFHETIHKDGMARMIRHDSLNISADNKLELKRGGPHLMLFNPTKQLKAGDTVNIKFTTNNNTAKTISIAVQKHNK